MGCILNKDTNEISLNKRNMDKGMKESVKPKREVVVSLSFDAGSAVRAVERDRLSSSNNKKLLGYRRSRKNWRRRLESSSFNSIRPRFRFRIKLPARILYLLRQNQVP